MRRTCRLTLHGQLYSRGPAVRLLIDSNVGRYISFKTLDRALLRAADGAYGRLPCTREDIFTSKSLSLVEKRHLTRFLTACVGDGSGLPDELTAAQSAPAHAFLREKQRFSEALLRLIDAVTLSPQPTEMAVGEAVRAVQRHVASAGQYSETAFIVPMYGGGELSQSFCRYATTRLEGEHYDHSLA